MELIVALLGITAFLLKALGESSASKRHDKEFEEKWSRRQADMDRWKNCVIDDDLEYRCSCDDWDTDEELLAAFGSLPKELRDLLQYNPQWLTAALMVCFGKLPRDVAYGGITMPHWIDGPRKAFTDRYQKFLSYVILLDGALKTNLPSDVYGPLCWVGMSNDGLHYLEELKDEDYRAGTLFWYPGRAGVVGSYELEDKG